MPAAEGTPLLILRGALRGKQGRLLQRNTGGWGGGGVAWREGCCAALHSPTHPPPTPPPESGLAAVQLSTDFTVHKLSLDDVSEYTGPQDAWGDE